MFVRSLRWSDQYAIHIPQIDTEHQEMFRIADEMRQALLAGDRTSRLALLCRRLAVQANTHFAHEERLMREAEYPAYAWHERQHRTARSKMSAFERDLHRGEWQPMLESLEVLVCWMRDHVSVADRMVGSYLRNYWRAREFAAAM